MKKNVSIVIIHYKAVEHLQRCLLRLHSQVSGYDITVVDNHSKQSLSHLKKKFQDVMWIENDRNRGFAFAANQGALHASGRWVLFLNPDVLMSPHEVEELFHFAEKNHLDAVSPTLQDERYQKPVPTLESLLSEFSPLHLMSAKSSAKKTLVGGCLLIKRKVLMELGGWDERYFLWFEDSDLTNRLHQSQYKVGFAPFSVEHIGGVSVNQLKEYLRRQIFFHSMDIYARKFFPLWQQKILRRAVIERFAHQAGYPVLNAGSTWVVPNMRSELLKDFLLVNERFFTGDELVVVTSALSAKDVWKFRREHPLVRFIFISHNKGFSSTVNIGFRVATTETYGTLNDDVILNEDSLTSLRKAFKPEMGSLNPVVYTISEQVESAGITVLKRGKAIPITLLPKNPIEVVTATNGACVLYNATALRDVGLLDEKFGSYLEDIDLSLRLRRHGYLNVVVKKSRVIHSKHSTSKRMGRYKQFLDFKNWCLVVLKNWSIVELVQHSPLIMVERLRNISGIFKA
jgi:GT2 family glycosyltransferase